MIYILILLAKIVEVSLMTIRTVLITKGERKIGAIIGFFEVMIWIFIASNVISDLANDPMKAVAYALGFSLGNYFGSRLEERIGLGLSEIKVIVKEHHGNDLVDKLRNDGYAVTVTKAEGKTTPRQILSLFVKRKNVKRVVNTITNSQKNAVITTTDIKPVYGGYGIRK
ncbi:DUF5698 domain-containing protein [Clostridiaceae bacterium HSG29]|nr:DUF5698 domain-containing protein [Clostridiaceae bacterium HSG29]